MALVSCRWSGKHHTVAQGINLVSLVWWDRDTCMRCNYCICNKIYDSLCKNDHFQVVLKQAKARGFQPGLVAFDSWYRSLENLKLVRDFG